MIKLDKRKPFGTVWGDHPASFHQDGHHFDAQGNCLDCGEVTDEESMEDTPLVPAPPAPVESDLPAPAPVESELNDLHWTEIKRRVEAAGGEWVNVKAGIAYLENI